MADHNIPVLTEQEIPKWNTPERRAILDLVWTDRRLGQCCTDITVVAAAVEGGSAGCLKVLGRREKKKHARYKGPGLFAFVVDARGRWGREAHAMVQAAVGHLPPKARATAIKDCRRRVSRALHFATAEQLMSAAGVGAD